MSTRYIYRSDNCPSKEISFLDNISAMDEQKVSKCFECLCPRVAFSKVFMFVAEVVLAAVFQIRCPKTAASAEVCADVPQCIVSHVVVFIIGAMCNCPDFMSCAKSCWWWCNLKTVDYITVGHIHIKNTWSRNESDESCTTDYQFGLITIKGN